MKNICVFFLFLAIAAGAKAQGGAPAGGQADGGGKITGKVIDSTTKQPWIMPQ